MSDLAIYPIEDIVKELRKRNISFVLAYCDHQQFNKDPMEDVVWAIDGGGNLVLQATLVKFINRWMKESIKTATNTKASMEEDEE